MVSARASVVTRKAQYSAFMSLLIPPKHESLNEITYILTLQKAKEEEKEV